MKNKITINSIFGNVLFEYEKENNTIKDTVVEAVKIGANLRGADLTGVDLRGADLRGANLRGADLTGAYLRGVDLRGANLTDANLRGADGNKIKIQKAAVFIGLYKYLVMPFIADDGEKWVRMGCFIRKLSEWENNFWNNDNEFPNDGSEQSKLRLFAFECAKHWFEVVESEKGGEG